MASMAPSPMSSLWAYTRSIFGLAWRKPSMTFLPPSRVKSPVCEATILNFGSVTDVAGSPRRGRWRAPNPSCPPARPPSPASASANSSLTHWPAFSPSRMKSEPMNVLYRSVSFESTARSVRMTGMPASCASRAQRPSPVSTTGENAIRSTPCAMKPRMDSTCDSCSPWASVNRRSVPDCLGRFLDRLRVRRPPAALGADLREPDLVLAQVGDLATGGRPLGRLRRGGRRRGIVAAGSAAPSVVLLSAPSSEFEPHAPSMKASATTIAPAVDFFLDTSVPPQ